MSDPLVVSEIMPSEVAVGNFGTPAILTEISRPGTSIRMNPVISHLTSVTISHTKKQFDESITTDDSSFVESMQHVFEVPTHTVIPLIGVDRPKSGLAKTKGDLKKQLQLKRAAHDDGRQTPNMPSPYPNLYSDDTKVSTTCFSAIASTKFVTDSSLGNPLAFADAKRLESSTTNETLKTNASIKTEGLESDYPTSSTERVDTNMGTLESDITLQSVVSEDVCPSPNDAVVSQSCAEVAGPTKWIIGDMLWARVSGHPWWPCMVAYDPTHTAFTRTLKRRQGSLVQYHVQFFGDEGERGWINENSIIPFEGLESFTKFCNDMIAQHKKDRQNYIVPARRLKAWNVAVKSAEEAYPMTRVFRVHRFAFVYDQPVVTNGSSGSSDLRSNGTPLSTKGAKRSRSSSVGGSNNESVPRKRQKISTEQNLNMSVNTSSLSPLSRVSGASPGSRAGDYLERDTSLLGDASSPENNLAVFRSRAEGVKRSSRFVKPTNRIMEHLEEVQQRRRMKLRPHRKIIGYAETTTAIEQSPERPETVCKSQVQELLTSSDKITPEDINHEIDSADKSMDTSFSETANTDYSQKNSDSQGIITKDDLSEKVTDSGALEKPVESHLQMYLKDSVVDKTTFKAAQNESGVSVETGVAPDVPVVVKVEESSGQGQHELQEQNLCESSCNLPIVHHHESIEYGFCSKVLEYDGKGPAVRQSEVDKVSSSTLCLPVTHPTLETPDELSSISQTAPIRKRQKRIIMQAKDSAGSNLRIAKRESNTNLLDSDRSGVSSNAYDVTATETFPYAIESSASNISCDTESQMKPPGRRKVGTVSLQRLSREESIEWSVVKPLSDDTDGVFIASVAHRNSRFQSGAEYQPEFQRLSTLGPQKVEEVCHICEQSGDVLIDCQGPCFGSYHLSCLGLIVSPVGSFRCDECSTGNHPCFVCKYTSRDTVACCASKCGRYYHRDCISKYPLSKVDSSSITCPLHTCTTCAAESGKIGRASKGPMYRCIRCPTAYHANDFCIAAGTVVIAGYNIICNNHLLSAKSPKKAVMHVNATWCFGCSKDGGSLVSCSSCPAAFHPSCAKISVQPGEPWQCKDCAVGKRPLYGEVVWAKVGNFRWWPGEVCHSRNLTVEVANMPHEAGQFALRLFGTGFHFWLQQGRVFSFHEGDRLSLEHAYRNKADAYEKAVSEATAVYRLRLAAKDAKTSSEREKNDQKPAYYKHVKVNVPLGEVEIYKAPPSEIPSCHCSQEMENPCGSDSDCINRLMLYECSALVCPAGERCQNQRFQKREDADARPYKTEQRGWGLRSRSDIKKGQFIAEYVGDLVDPEECNRRLEEAHRNNIANFYMLTLDKNRIIDAGPKGNYSRFMNHSCEPNCETQKWTVNGDIRIGLFALHDIPAGTELMFNYNLDCYGNQKTICKCSSSICSGFLGVRPKTAAAVSTERKSREAKLKKQLKEMKGRMRLDACYVCKKKGELIVCDEQHCQKAYHMCCLNLSSVLEGNFICPRHRCDSCGEATSKLCSICPQSFCMLHLTGNIFEVSDGSLVCLKHTDILESCLQDNWNNTAVDRTNGTTLTGNHDSNPENILLKHIKNTRKQTTGYQTPLKRTRVEVEDSTDSGITNPQTGSKKRGRPTKKIHNGSIDKVPVADKTDVDLGLNTVKQEKVVNRRSRATGADSSSTVGMSVTRRNRKLIHEENQHLVSHSRAHQPIMEATVPDQTSVQPMKSQPHEMMEFQPSKNVDVTKVSMLTTVEISEVNSSSGRAVARSSLDNTQAMNIDEEELSPLVMDDSY